ncbi:type VI secretion system TssO [Tenacibaculum geojense]|uniref:Type VI secretion system TssO n=2 Tax=Tenacibaculum TaxID=104267 RepID=A0ABW3JRI4_9FLAO
MKPKNTKERRNSFIKFLLLFLLTTATIVTAVFFTFKVPVKENNILKTQAKNFDKEIQFQSEFSNRMRNIKKLVDSLDVPGQNVQYINQLIGKDLAELQKSIPNKNSAYKHDMYYDVVNLYLEIQNMKGKLSKLKNAEETIEEYKIALEKAKEEYKTLERDLLIERNR